LNCLSRKKSVVGRDARVTTFFSYTCSRKSFEEICLDAAASSASSLRSGHNSQKLLVVSEFHRLRSLLPAAVGQSAVRHATTTRNRSRGLDRNSEVRKDRKSLILIKPSSRPSKTREIV